MALAAMILTVGYTIHRDAATRAQMTASRAADSIHGSAAPASSGASSAAAPAVPERSVAVLAFVDMSEKKDQEYFADGLAEELLDLLGASAGPQSAGALILVLLSRAAPCG